ncbi:tyrosine-type recombinase/integrase [Aneurinibacillus aneurinilyticus]|uniref:tyrosine-type recombinase/integrase n=1 Tax=Aneurinibacillus aneurinilyticus TaxID=1391 RepID=UPI0023F9FB04|nr:tyrosine-type recombinase/integrase [Aneurinibacillus aneurinilyticus]MCI1696811.1 tyrosine-type recombinase/integrase [Aneurinibacillus aneurinilyticus]
MRYINEFRGYLQSKDKSENTIFCYIRDTKAFMEWYSSKTEYGLEKIIEFDGVQYKKHLQSEYKSFVTINRKIASVNSFLKWLKEKGHIDEEIAIKTVKDKDVKQYKGLENKELWRIRSEIHRLGNRMHICIIELLLGTGIRVSELTHIQLTDIQMTPRKGLLTVKGKGNSKRTLPLNKDTRKAITQYLEVRPECDSDYLLIGQRGTLQRNAINLILKHYGDRVKVKVTPHQLRHSLGYNLVKQGVPLTTIQQILGHDSVSTTNMYTLTTQKDMAEALENVKW